MEDKATVVTLGRLQQYPGVPTLGNIPEPVGPVLPVTFVKEGRRFSYFSILSTVGLPQDITAQELRIESMFPA